MRTLISVLFLAHSVLCTSQWTDDPVNPLVICNAGGQQRYPLSLEDGTGGWFIFWQDARASSGNFAIYGQHLNEEGYSLWTPNGEFIIEHPGAAINAFTVETLSSGDMLLVYGSQVGGGTDSLRAMLLNTEGEHLWDEPVLVAGRQGTVLAFHQPLIQPSGTGAILAYRAQITGGSHKTHVDRIESDGTLLYGFNGLQVITSTAHGPWGIMTDENEGAILYWRDSNGGGTHMGAIRLTSTCSLVWPGIVDPVAGTPGLYYDFRAVKDGQGGIAIAYVETGSKIKFLRLNGNGEQICSPAIKTVADFSSSQDKPRLILQNNEFIICWEDNRPPANNHDLFIQKLDMNGDPVWAPEGLLAMHDNTYIPWNAICPTDSGGVIVTQLMSLSGFRAQRVRQDGSTAWNTTAQMCVDNIVPFYGEYNLMPKIDGGAAAFWYNQNSSNLYGARVSFNGQVTPPSGVDEINVNHAAFLFPNPSSGMFFMDQKWVNSLSRLEVYDLSGRRVFQAQDIKVQVDLSILKPGTYVVGLVLKDGQKRTQQIILN